MPSTARSGTAWRSPTTTTTTATPRRGGGRRQRDRAPRGGAAAKARAEDASGGGRRVKARSVGEGGGPARAPSRHRHHSDHIAPPSLEGHVTAHAIATRAASPRHHRASVECVAPRHHRASVECATPRRALTQRRAFPLTVRMVLFCELMREVRLEATFKPRERDYGASARVSPSSFRVASATPILYVLVLVVGRRRRGGGGGGGGGALSASWRLRAEGTHTPTHTHTHTHNNTHASTHLHPPRGRAARA